MHLGGRGQDGQGLRRARPGSPRIAQQNLRCPSLPSSAFWYPIIAGRSLHATRALRAGHSPTNSSSALLRRLFPRKNSLLLPGPRVALRSLRPSGDLLYQKAPQKQTAKTRSQNRERQGSRERSYRPVQSPATSYGKVWRIHQTRTAPEESPDPTHLRSVDGSYASHRYPRRRSRWQERPTKPTVWAAKSCRLNQEEGTKMRVEKPPVDKVCSFVSGHR